MKVKDVMTKNPVTISPDETIDDARNCINRLRIWSLPVISDGKFLGIVTKSDLDHKGKSSRQKIKDIMSKTVVQISPDEELAIALEKLKRTRVNALPVVSGDKLIGILTRYDVYKKSILKNGIVNCPYCSSVYKDSELKCPNCGAPLYK